jgi:dTDP-4-dehydrorhamnose 3,5-epimerase
MPTSTLAPEKFRALSIPDAFEITPNVHPDERGTFLEWFKEGPFVDALGHPLNLAQANCSVSRRGTLRGIHYADVPPSQAKYVTCFQGAVLDVVVDIRDGSPTFGQWDSVVLDDQDHRAVYVAEGLGHAFLALTDHATAAYLCSAPYSPSREHGLNPLDRELGIAWPRDIEPLLSLKDAQAPTLTDARAQGLLPTYAACRELYAHLRERGSHLS